MIFEVWRLLVYIALGEAAQLARCHGHGAAFEKKVLQPDPHLANQ